MTLSNSEISAYNKALIEEKTALIKEDSETVGSRETVALDQQSVGRLSRMDALQMQAMANATQRRRAARGVRIDAALQRIETGEFGYCQDCGEEISKKRLDLDPTIPNCVSCAKG